MYGVGCEVVYGTDGVESCMEQVVSNRVLGGVRGCVWNRWCRIMHGVGCEVVYGTDGVESCIGLKCEVVYGTDYVESCMGCDARSYMEQGVSNRVWGEMRGRV